MSSGVGGGAGATAAVTVLSSPLLPAMTTATTTTMTTSIYKRGQQQQRQVIVLGSSSPLPLPSAAEANGGPASPTRQKTTTSRALELPLGFYSSPPPAAEALSVAEQTRGAKSQAWKTGSRAEAIPDGAFDGFRSAREVVAELKEPDAVPEHGLDDSITIQTDAAAASNPTQPQPQPQPAKQRRGRKRKSDELEVLDRPSHGHDASSGKLKRVRKSKASAATTIPTSDDMNAMSVFWNDEPKAVAKPDTCVPPEKTTTTSKPKRKSRSKKIKEVSGQDTDMTPVAPHIPEPVAKASSSRPKKTTTDQGRSLDLTKDDIGQLQDKKQFDELDAQQNPISKASTERPEEISIGEPSAQPDPATTKDFSQPARQKEVLREVPRPQIEQAQNIQKAKKASPVKPTSPTKPLKKPAKSSRTVTGIVLARFDSPEKACPPAYDAKQLLGAAPPGDAKPKRKRASAKSKAKQVTPVKLITPTELRRRVRAHDTLFGTSSQLAAEDSPRTIRMLQQAYRESEAAAVEHETRTEATRQSLPTSPSPDGKKSLWSVACRGDDGCSYEPDPWTSPQISPIEPVESFSVSREVLEKQEEEDFEDIDLVISRPQPQQEDSQEEPLSRLQLSRPARSATPRMRITGASSFVMPRPPAAVLSAGISTKSPMASPRRVSQPAVGQDSAAARSSPKKPRGRAPKDTTAKSIEAPAAAAPPKKPRGRPRKDPAADPAAPKTPRARQKAAAIAKKRAAVTDDGFVAIEDAILDPDPPPTPSPPRRRASPVAPLALNLSDAAIAAVPAGESSGKGLPTSGPVNMRKAMADPANVARMNVLFPQITRAVRNAPRGTCTAPSWWEKMLLYDPIVIEDLCDWLNEQALDVGAASSSSVDSATKDNGRHENQLVPAWMVQRWCEEKSVCCLWRGGLRGGVTARY